MTLFATAVAAVAAVATPMGAIYGLDPTAPRQPHTDSAAAIKLWPGLAPGERPGQIGAESSSCLNHSVPVKACKDLSVHNVTVPVLEPFLVDGADSAVIVAPGGGYEMLAVDREGSDIAAWLNSVGISAFVLKYRVPERWWLPFGAAPLMDAQRMRRASARA